MIKTVCNIFHDKVGHSLIDSHYYFKKITKRINNNQECPYLYSFRRNTHHRLIAQEVKSLKKDAYELNINKDGILLSFGSYSGYVYALETLSQLV